MRLTIDLMNRAEQRTNCLGEREIILSGYGIPMIENIATLEGNIEQLHTCNLNNNLLIRLDNFSKWHQLGHLLLSNNHIESIDGNNVLKNIPNIHTLIISHNNISSYTVLQTLGKSCTLLKFLDLTGNPITRKPYYRLYTIYCIPTLQCLDCIRIKREERKRANKFIQSTAGIAFMKDIQQLVQLHNADSGSSSDNGVKTFVPGESMDGTSVVTLFTSDEKEAIRQLLINAQSVQEVEEIEASVRKGILPIQLQAQQQQKQQQQGAEQKELPKRSHDTNVEDENGNDNVTAPASKRIKVT